MTLDEAKIGDVLAVGGRLSSLQLLPIVRTTPTQVICGDKQEKRFRRSDGYLVGQRDAWNIVRARIATPEDFLSIRIVKAQYEVQRVIVNKTNVEAVEQLLALLRAQPKEQAGA